MATAATRSAIQSGTSLRCLGIGLLWLLAIVGSAGALQAQGVLGQLREDVRSSGDGVGDSEPQSEEHKGRDSHDDYDDDWLPEDTWGLLVFPAAIAASPVWVPHAVLGDDFSVPGAFARFPYEYPEGGCMVIGTSGQWCPTRPPCSWGDCLKGTVPVSPPRCWAGRLRADWAGNGDDLERIEGHLLLSTASRFDVDTQFGQLRETLPADGRDELWLGDANLVFRFAQNEKMQFRTGVGFNWLDDGPNSDFGVNVTYGADWFPLRPWILSTELDWGTLGSAELFRFRSTVGVTVHGIEVFLGYEYLDIDRLHQNLVLSGLGLWF
jgi:hypothetical protein